MNDVVEKRNPKHQKLCEKGCELQEKLEEKLDDDGKKLLSQLIDCIVDEQIYNSQKKYIRGYSLGMLMAFEVFEDYDSFLGKER